MTTTIDTGVFLEEQIVALLEFQIKKFHLWYGHVWKVSINFA